jgi:hypothetical protein
MNLLWAVNTVPLVSFLLSDSIPLHPPNEPETWQKRDAADLQPRHANLPGEKGVESRLAAT